MKKVNKKDLSLDPKEVSSLNRSKGNSKYETTQICGAASIPPACDPTIRTCINTMGPGCGDGTEASKCLCMTENACGTQRCGTEVCTSVRIDIDCPADTKQQCQIESRYMRVCVEPISFGNNECETENNLCAHPIETRDANCALLTNEDECDGTNNCTGIFSDGNAESCHCTDLTEFCIISDECE